jgi:hypothetical protein
MAGFPMQLSAPPSGHSTARSNGTERLSRFRSV